MANQIPVVVVMWEIPVMIQDDRESPVKLMPIYLEINTSTGRYLHLV
jgi:hypothetical protein